MGFLSKLLGKNKTTDQPGESFSIMQATVDGKPLFATINMAYKRFAGKDAFPWRLNVLAPLTDPTPDGLTKNNEAAELNGLEDAVTREIAKVCRYHYIGRITWDGARQSFYYLDDPKPVAQRLQEMMGSGLYKNFTFLCEQDPGWDAVAQFLSA